MRDGKKTDDCEAGVFPASEDYRKWDCVFPRYLYSCEQFSDLGPDIVISVNGH